MLKFVITLSFALFMPHIWAQQAVPGEVLAELRKAKVPLDAVSFSVKTVGAAPQTRLVHRDQAPMNPASVMKLVTTFAGLDQLGPDYTWKTRFYATGPLESGEIKGNLVIKGGGDPKWVLERIADDLKALRSKGVQGIEGDIVLDRSIFDLPPQSPASFDGESLRPYNATPDGLLVNFKSLIYTFSPDIGSKSVLVTTEPPMADLQVNNHLQMVSGPCGDWRSELQADYSRADVVQFNGQYRVNCGERSWPVAYAAPEQFALRVIKAMYLQSGGTLKGSVRYDTLSPGAKLLYEAKSLPLASLIADINKFSNNVMAQQLFLTMGLRAKTKANFETAQHAVRQWWKSNMGVRTTSPDLENGSGLSRRERISAYALNELLQKAADHPSGAAFEQSLGVLGVDGTVKNMGQNPGMAPLVGKAALKTGTLKDVIAIAGYLTSASSTRYVVVAIINHPNAPNARPVFDALLSWAARDAQ